MTLNKPQVLLLSLAIATAVSACAKKPEPAVETAATPAATAASYTLDESKLPAVNRFSIADLDTSKDACTDFGGYKV